MNHPIDWAGLRMLRTCFLEQSFPESGYWSSRKLLEDYDRTFAQRIGWKWDAVFEELKTRGWTPPVARLTDWGCGSGIASRKFLEHFGEQSVEDVSLWDSSSLAMEYTESELAKNTPKVAVRQARQAPYKKPGVLLLSHVVNELDADGVDYLVKLASHADAVIWVEPGTHAESRRLAAIRDRLCKRLQPVAPCTHAEPCPVLLPENERHWCHHFTRPPMAVHQSPEWSAFTRELKIDLGTVPYSFLVMTSRAYTPPDEYVRVVGHPRVFKGFCNLLCCNKSGLHDWSLPQKVDKSLYKEVKKEKYFPMLCCEVHNERISSVKTWVSKS
jgi:hypothetical protein